MKLVGSQNHLKKRHFGSRQPRQIQRHRQRGFCQLGAVEGNDNGPATPSHGPMDGIARDDNRARFIRYARFPMRWSKKAADRPREQDAQRLN